MKDLKMANKYGKKEIIADAGEKYRWSNDSTSLLVSVWSDKQVQKQLEYSTNPENTWDSIARYMSKKGYNVTGKQCRSRMKRILVCYRESKKMSHSNQINSLFDLIDRALLKKHNENLNTYSKDTVDSVSNVKSPPKEVKTNQNLQMRHNTQEPNNCIYRTSALTPTWIAEKNQDYPDSPESHETVLAQPFRVFSPVRDAATNTRHQLTELTGKMKRNIMPEEMPIKETITQTHLQNYINEVPLQNAVQNVQNQIIQENMQQNQALLQQTLLQKRLLEQNLANPIFQQHYQNKHQTNYIHPTTIPISSDEISQPHLIAQSNVYPEQILRIQNQYQQNSIPTNLAMPQEPRKSAFMRNSIPRQNYVDLNLIESPSYSPDNLNDAFCQTDRTEVSHNLNETFNQPRSNNNGIHLPNIDNTIMTNNATFNDDTLSIEFIQDSSSVSDNEQPKSKDCSVNTDLDTMPSAPFRKKRQQKLEQLMLNAINSQNDVVNKILSAQNDMVNRFLDVDRDRQNRLEHRLDNLFDVVRATVLNKSNDKESQNPTSEEPLIQNLFPPPKPGVVPPKLDLVPPKPCRVPCTVANYNVELINQNPINTRPGVVSPMMSPIRKPGAIWEKLGPVSTSPFVRAHQQLGFPIPANSETKTKSSAERRITKDSDINQKNIIYETMAFIELEKQSLELAENSRLKCELNTNNSARRKLFPLNDSAMNMILTSAFLEVERKSQAIFESARITFEKSKMDQLKKNFMKAMDKKCLNEHIILGQSEGFKMNGKIMQPQEENSHGPYDSSTPAKLTQKEPNNQEFKNFEEPRQSIQQLAKLVMNSARWRDVASASKPSPFNYQNSDKLEILDQECIKLPGNKPKINYATMDSNAKTLNWIQDRYSYSSHISANTLPNKKNRFSYNGPIPGIEPLGFVNEKLISDETDGYQRDYGKRVGFVDEQSLAIKKEDLEDKDHLEKLTQLYFECQERKKYQSHGNIFLAQQKKILEQYIKDMAKTKGVKGSESDSEEEFLDTTTTMQPRRGSINSGTSSKASKATRCVIS